MTKQEMVRIVNTTARLLQIPGAKADAEVAEQSGDPVGKVYPRTQLIPGGQDIPMGHMLALAKLDRTRGVGKVWRHWQNLGWVKPGNQADVSKPAGPGAPESLGPYADKGALALIMGLDDASTLRRLYTTDRREEIRAAITSRLAALGTSLDAEDEPAPEPPPTE